jgi:hypothetical protein
MKKMLIFIFAIYFNNLFAQDTVHLKIAHKVIITDKIPQAVFAEIFGRSIYYSANYDRRFFKRLNGLGFTAGIGYTNEDDINLFSIPVTVNYLFGTNGRYFEVGAGATYFNNININSYFDIDGISELRNGSWTTHAIIGTTTVGYRAQPITKGFMLRAGINLVFLTEGDRAVPYLSLGYSF